MKPIKDRIICSRCIYDEYTPKITFDAKGVCNYCHQIDMMEKEYPTGPEGEKRLQAIVEEIRKAGKGKAYDCAVGISGGCDSSFMLYKMKEYGLRPLAVHFDNTWNSTIATQNIKRLTDALDIDLYTYVVDNKEYDDLYRSFIKAGVPDLEATTDIALASTLYMACEKYGIKYIIEGHSFRTEGICPLGWTYMDGRYIAGVQEKFGTMPLKTYPNMSLFNFIKWTAFMGIKKIRPLYYMDYQKEEAKKLLNKKFGWEWYGGHHLENRFCAFYHSYFMPQRFDVDMRALGFAALMRSGQLPREEGVKLIASPCLYDSELVELVKKRLGFSDEEFERLMRQPKKTYRDYKNYKKTFERLRWLFWLLYKMNLVPKSFYIKYAHKD